MRTHCFKLFLLITGLVLSTNFTFAQYEWAKYPTNPLSIHGTSGSWDESVVTPCVIFNSDLNRYEMWYTQHSGVYPNNGVGFAWSTDGITWTKHPTAVLTPGATGWDSLFVGAVCVIKEGGIYKIWYTGWKSTTRYPHSIGYATSSDGINWTKHLGNPVLSPGTGWESGAVGYPSIIKVTGGYWMFYSGEVSNGIALTGRAFSTDGITWQKDLTNNPVLPAGDAGTWDRNNYLARVLELNGTLYLCYTGQSNPGVSGDAIGIATSVDTGKTWTKFSGNPVISQGITGSWDNGWIETGSILFAQNELKLYYDGGGAATGWKGRIGLAISAPLPSGTYTIGVGGNFATIQDAFNKLETDGVAGNVTLELIDEFYTAPTDSFGFKLNGPIPGAGPDSRVTIKPAENKNVILEGNGQNVLFFMNTSYVTLDGVDLSGATTLSVHSITNTQFDINNALGVYDNSDYDEFKNLIVSVEDYLRSSRGIFITGGTNPQSVPDSNLIMHNFIRKAGVAILLDKTTNNIIKANDIGSETDSLISWGIQSQRTLNTLIEENHVQNLRFGIAYECPGIDSYLDNGCIIRNNIVHNIDGKNARDGGFGIELSGDNGNPGINNMVYNNMVYDIRSSSNRAAGLQLWYVNNSKIYYNTVYLSGNGTGTTTNGSAALYISHSCTNVEAKNNILVNTRDESPYYASAIYDYSASNLTSDYNDLYSLSNPNNCLVRIASTKYNTLADWQATGKDLHSISEMPNFLGTDLHIDTSIPTNLEKHATPLVGIVETDFDGEARHTTTPDVGADEFDGIVVPVELISFTATSNGKEVLLIWSTATEINNLGFEIQRSTVGKEFFTIGFINGYGTTTEQKNYTFEDKNLNSGKYYYRLKQVDYDGGYEYSDVVEVEWRAFNSYLLEQNYPNPFNPLTTIGFGIEKKNNVRIVILNSIGEEVAIVLNEVREPGFHQVEFNAANLPSGVYFYQLSATGGAGEFMSVKKMLLIK